mmetsp:Transcript_129771/g.307898  ORF Transcript_129771/g.307898 Transcript_129771/m.307898 type:complete len:248 (+) Transcript_129771:211-954(+)
MAKIVQKKPGPFISGSRTIVLAVTTEISCRTSTPIAMYMPTPAGNLQENLCFEPRKSTPAGKLCAIASRRASTREPLTTQTFSKLPATPQGFSFSYQVKGVSALFCGSYSAKWHLTKEVTSASYASGSGGCVGGGSMSGAVGVLEEDVRSGRPPTVGATVVVMSRISSSQASFKAQSLHSTGAMFRGISPCSPKETTSGSEVGFQIQAWSSRAGTDGQGYAPSHLKSGLRFTYASHTRRTCSLFNGR